MRLAFLLVLLYGFFLGLDLMGLSFKLFGKGFAERLVETTSNPFASLLIGILATSLVQSSSTTTSMIVGMVAAGALTLEGAIPMIMGANIGTSVTNTIVSLAHVTRREEFRRAFAGATVHDFFNWLAVALLLPLEIFTGFLGRVAWSLEELLEGAGGIKLLNPLKEIVRPVAEMIRDATGGSGLLTLAAGVVLLVLGLRYLVSLLRTWMSGRAENLLHRTLFRSAPAAVLAGLVITVMVQSSSITTSTVVPLVGAGVITLERLFPFTVGANLGTTVTAMLAALSTGNPAAVAVAISHLLFNLAGAMLIYGVPPMRRIPLALARGLGNIAAKNRTVAIVYVLVLFFGLPLLMLFLSGALEAPLTDPTLPPVPGDP